MGNDDDRALNFFVHFFKYINQIFKAPKVNACFGLIEQGQLCFSCHNGCDFDTLQLTAGKACVYLTVDVILGAHANLGQILTGICCA